MTTPTTTATTTNANELKCQKIRENSLLNNLSRSHALPTTLSLSLSFSLCDKGTPTPSHFYLHWYIFTLSLSLLLFLLYITLTQSLSLSLFHTHTVTYSLSLLSYSILYIFSFSLSHCHSNIISFSLPPSFTHTSPLSPLSLSHTPIHTLTPWQHDFRDFLFALQDHFWQGDETADAYFWNKKTLNQITARDLLE